jgi:Arc/MetJ-type ribon-helix-helix transcriptional regulator
MNLSLPKDLEEFVRKEVATGEYPDATAVVVEALREFQSKTDDGISEEINCPADLKALLLEAVKGPHNPLPADYFDQLRKRLRPSGAR